MLISTGREVHKTREVKINNGTISFLKDAYKILTFDTNDKVYFRLYETMNPTMCVSQGIMIVQHVLIEISAYGDKEYIVQF